MRGGASTAALNGRSGRGEPQKLELPKQPRLAPDVRLAGQMEESAYKEAPWLLEREDSGYVQVTELLYRIAERCDGQRTYEQIAREVSEATGREVSAENVAQLTARELLAKGLVADAHGRVVKPPAAARSLLAIRKRLSLLGPDKIHPLSDALKALFWPPILLLVLGAAAAAEWWLFAMHGVGGGLHDAIYNPALILPLLMFIVASAAFHEFGHAAALRYGGGNVRAMGAGFYLIYPVLYTDVSDNYRLKRWARVRTDLGGFYFNLIFALGLMAAYAATQQEFLLLVVALINLDIVKQLLPFIRLDGYWVLADITGMPDFFSQMGAFVKSWLPGRLEDGKARPPELKWWAKAFFTLYILVTIPFLIFSAFLMVRSVPRVLATVWDSGGRVVGRMAEENGDPLAIAGLAGQLLLLAIPAAGISYAALNLLRRGHGLIVAWSRGNLVKATLGSAIAGAALTGVVFLWLPSVPVIGTPGPLYSASAFAPIQPNERFSLRDAAVGAPTARDGAPLDVQVQATPQGVATSQAGQATPGATAQGTVPPGTPRPAASAPAGVAPVSTVSTVSTATATARPGQGGLVPVATATTATTTPAASPTAPAQQAQQVPSQTAAGTAAATASPSRAAGTPIASPTRSVATATPTVLR